MKILPGQGGLGLAADGVSGELCLHQVVGVVRNIADPAPVDYRRLFLLRQKPVEFGVVAGGDDQGVDRPFIALHFDGPVLDHTKVDLDEIFLVLVDFVREMDAPSGHPGKRAAPEIEAVRVVGIGYVKQPLNGFFAEEVHCRGGYLVFCRIFTGHRAETLGQRNRNDLDELQHFLDVTAGEIPDVVPHVGAVCPKGPVAVEEGHDFPFGKADPFGKELHAVVGIIEQVHGKHRRILVRLGFDGRDLSVGTDPVHPDKAEGIATILRPGKELPVLGAQVLNKEGLAVTRFADQHESHFLGGPPLGRIFHEGDEAVDLVVHPDGMLFAGTENGEIVGGARVHHDLFDPPLQDHPRNRLESVLESPFSFFHLSQVMKKTHHGIVHGFISRHDRFTELYQR